MTDRELMQQALDLLDDINQCSLPPTGIPLPAEIDHVMEALRARLAQPEQEPVLWAAKESMFMWGKSDEHGHPYHIICKGQKVRSHQIPLYTAPPQREWQGLTDEELHLQAATYAINRKNAYVEGMKSGEVDHMNEEALNGKWLAHYEGYREGYWVATGDDRYTTDPAKLKEKNNAV